MKNALVTGATGLLGSNLVRELAARGVAVRAVARDPARAKRLLDGIPALEIVRGDLDDVAGFAPALDGADVVFHAAAYFRESYRGGTHWERLRRTNVEGTRRLIDAAYARGVRRILHVSSIGTLATAAPGGRPVDAAMRIAPEATRNDYFRSKILADREAEEALARHPDLWIAFVLPGFMNGPGDSGPTSAGQTILDYAAGRLPGVIDAHLSYVDARDVAKACVETALSAKRGARYVGRPVLIGLATYRNLREQGAHNRYDSSPAERDLGIRFRPVEETLRDAAAWLRAAGMLPGAAPSDLR
jgi:dihydroflavonol-4-reductase